MNMNIPRRIFLNQNTDLEMDIRLMNIPRRNFLDQNTDLEIDIRIIMSRIEKMPAHPSLTEAIMKLQEAFEHLADYNDQNASK